MSCVKPFYIFICCRWSLLYWWYCFVILRRWNREGEIVSSGNLIRRYDTKILYPPTRWLYTRKSRAFNYKSGIMHNFHCKCLVVTATYFKRLPFIMMIDRLKNKKCQTIFWLSHSFYFLKVECICIHLFIFIFMIQICCSKQNWKWNWTPLLQNIRTFKFSTLHILFILSGAQYHFKYRYFSTLFEVLNLIGSVYTQNINKSKKYITQNTLLYNVLLLVNNMLMNFFFFQTKWVIIKKKIKKICNTFLYFMETFLKILIRYNFIHFNKRQK